VEIQPSKQREAQEALTVATTMFGEMHMRFWLQQAEAEPGNLGDNYGV
jgi:hypothetical protein